MLWKIHGEMIENKYGDNNLGSHHSQDFRANIEI